MMLPSLSVEQTEQAEELDWIGRPGPAGWVLGEVKMLCSVEAKAKQARYPG
jgi:hypothetical protein